MSIEAARKSGEPLDRVLFSAPPGLGKTSLGHIIARGLGVNLRVTSGPAIERTSDLVAIVNDPDRGRAATRSIVWRGWSKRFSTPRWRTSSSMSRSGKAGSAYDLHTTFGAPTERLGTYSIVPWIAAFCIGNVAGWIADGLRQRGMRITAVR
jgi:Holliday junction DNA helicase RuvB P-loop domain